MTGQDPHASAQRIPRIERRRKALVPLEYMTQQREGHTHQEGRREHTHRSGEHPSQQIGQGRFEDPIVRYVGKRAPKSGGDKAHDQRQAHTEGNEDLDQSVTSQPLAYSKPALQTFTYRAAREGAKTETGNEAAQNHHEGEVGRAEAIGVDTKPDDLIAEAHEPRQAVEEKKLGRDPAWTAHPDSGISSSGSKKAYRTTTPSRTPSSSRSLAQYAQSWFTIWKSITFTGRISRS